MGAPPLTLEQMDRIYGPMFKDRESSIIDPSTGKPFPMPLRPTPTPTKGTRVGRPKPLPPSSSGTRSYGVTTVPAPQGVFGTAVLIILGLGLIFGLGFFVGIQYK